MRSFAAPPWVSSLRRAAPSATRLRSRGRALCERCDAELAPRAPSRPALVPASTALAPQRRIAGSARGPRRGAQVPPPAARSPTAPPRRSLAGFGGVRGSAGPRPGGAAAPPRARLRPRRGDRARARRAAAGSRSSPACAAARARARSAAREPSGSRTPPRVLAARAPRRAEAVLVDDVITTGATLAACARALRDGGASGSWRSPSRARRADLACRPGRRTLTGDSTRGGDVRIEIRGRNLEVTDELAPPRREALRADRPPGRRRGPARRRAQRGAQPGDRRALRRRGDALPQGSDAARPRGDARR